MKATRWLGAMMGVAVGMAAIGARAEEARGAAGLDPASRKARVAVMPAVYAQGVRSKFQRELQEKWGMTDVGVIETPGYTSFIVDALVNTRKLDVVERENLAPVIKELDFGVSETADVAKVVRLGKLLNADYVMIPEIRYMSVWMASKEIPYLGVQQKDVNGKLATSVRTVEVATGRIVASNIADVEDKTRFKEQVGPEWQQMKDFIDGLYRKSGMAEAAHIVGIVNSTKNVP
jgi:curli biogenesis system outer membrane secretion channel CsgG